MNIRRLIWEIAIIGILILGSSSIFLYLNPDSLVRHVPIANFEECRAAGYPIMESYPEQCRTPEGETFVNTATLPSEIPTYDTVEDTSSNYSEHEQLNKPVAFTLGESKTFVNGITITLYEISDSRCKEGVQCFWQGELAPVFRITNDEPGSIESTVTLGTLTNESVTYTTYTVTLIEATENSALIKVTDNNAGVLDKGTGTISGHVTIGPICPVESIDRPCVVPPETYTSRKVVISDTNTQAILTELPLDANGNYTLEISSGTYFIQIQPAGMGLGEKRKIVVQPGQAQIVDFDIDTGIR